MARDKFSYFHGDAGTQPPNATDFSSGDIVEHEYFNWWWDSNVTKINDLWDEFTRLDNDDDGVVDKAESATDADASTYKGNDIDSDGDGTVDAAAIFNNLDTRTSDPSSPSNGRMWLRTDEDEVRFKSQNGIEVIPVEPLGASNSQVKEILRLRDDGSDAFLPLTDKSRAAYSYLRLHTDDYGELYFHDEPIIRKTIDSYEDGGLTEYFGATGSWTVEDEGDAGAITTAFDGTKYVKPSSTVTLSDYLFSASGDGLNDYFAYNESVQIELDIIDLSNINRLDFVFALNSSSTDTGEHFSAFFDPSQDEFGIAKDGSVFSSASSASLYSYLPGRITVEVRWGTGTNEIEAEVYDDSGNSLIEQTYNNSSYQTNKGVGLMADASADAFAADYINLIEY